MLLRIMTSNRSRPRLSLQYGSAGPARSLSAPRMRVPTSTPPLTGRDGRRGSSKPGSLAAALVESAAFAGLDVGENTAPVTPELDFSEFLQRQHRFLQVWRGAVCYSD